MKRMLIGGRYNSVARTVADGESDDIAMDADGAVHVSDGGNSLTIDGTVTANLSAVDNAVLDTIDADTSILAAAVPGGQTIWRATVHYASAQTNTELVAAPGSGLSLYITDILISNGPVAGNVLIEEDTGSAKTPVIEKLYFGVNGGTGRNFQTPLKLTAEKNLGVTSVSCTNHSVTVSGYTAA